MTTLKPSLPKPPTDAQILAIVERLTAPVPRARLRRTKKAARIGITPLPEDPEVTAQVDRNVEEFKAAFIEGLSRGLTQPTQQGTVDSVVDGGAGGTDLDNE